LLETSDRSIRPAQSGSDPDRGKGDIREELDRIGLACSQAANDPQGGPIGRRLDFLARNSTARSIPAAPSRTISIDNTVLR